MNVDLSRPKIRTRHLSDFMCKEMMYDFVSKKLDHSREKAVQEHMQKNQHLQKDLEKIRFALKYCEDLSQTEIAADFIEMVDEKASSQISTLVARLKWQYLPEQLRWSIQAISLSVLAGYAIYLTPWQKIKNFIPEKVEFTKVEAPRHEQPAPAVNVAAVPVVAAPVAPSPAAKVPVVAEKQLEPVVEEPHVIPNIAKEESEGQVDLSLAQGEGRLKKDAKKTVVQGNQAQFKGLLYRMYMSHEDVDKITSEVIDKITALGGEKAGDVKLGWRKSDGSYFHLTLDESNYDTLMSYLQTFGPVRISKDPHWRVMPAGKIRIILWIEGKKEKK